MKLARWGDSLPPVSYATAGVTSKSHTSVWCVIVCHFEQYQKTYFYHYKVSFPSQRGGLCGLIPPKQNFKPPQIKITSTTNRKFFVKVLDAKPPSTNVKTLMEDFLTTVLQSSVEARKKLVIHLRSTWMTDRIRYFPVVQKQYFTNILHPRQCGKDSCQPPLKQQLPIISFLSQWIS